MSYLQLARRPRGVTLLAVLHVTLGILLLIGVFAMAVLGLGFPEMIVRAKLLQVRASILAMGLALFAAIAFLLAYGLWNGKSWAWVASLVFAVLGIISAAVSLSLRLGLGEVISLILDLLIVYCLMQPNVQAYFRKSPASPVGESSQA